VTEICVNKVINDLDTGAKYLVLWVAPGIDYGYWYELTGNARTPLKFTPGDLVEADSIGRYDIFDYVPEQQRDESTLTYAERNHRDRIWNMMKGAVEYEPDIYDTKTRGTMLRIIAEEYGVERSNLYNYLDRYWRSGKTKNAFLPKFHNRGGKGVPRQSGGKKIGRKASGNGVPGKALTKQDRINFETAIKKYYLNRNKLTIKDVYEKLLADFYAKPHSNKSKQIELFPPEELPSLRQFRYWYSTNRDTITEQKKRDGERAFELTGRRVMGKSDYGLMGPGAQFQVDATVGDIYLVSQFDRSNLIGRPVMYFVVDSFSRMVTGMSIGLEGPSWAGAMTALANMAADKVAYCKEFGVEINESDWPCRHIPASLLGDRGEMESRNADNLVNMLGIRVVNAPPYRADLKGIVEQHFRTINTKTAALLPGSVKPDMAQRGGHDYRLDAKLDIRQFTQIIIKCVLYYNNHHYMDYFEKTEDMMGDHIEAIPIKLWNWGIRHISGALRSFPEEQVRLAVMPTAKGSVTEKGIRFKGMLYSCDKAVSDAWFEKARAKKSWQVDILYDPRNMANIYVRNQGDTSYELCSLLDWNGKNAGKCLDEIIYEQRKENIIGKQLKAAETEAKVNLNAEIEAIASQAQNMAKGLPKKSKYEQVSRIKENRNEERKTMRATSTKTTNGEMSSVKQPPVSTQRDADEELSPRLRMIKAKAEEQLKND
jgi:hypothetical protein